MVDRGSEWSDVGCGVVDNVTVKWDELKEVLVYEFFLGVPKLLVVLVNDCILVWVAVVGGGTSGGSEELREKSSGNRVGWRFDGKRWERSGCMWSRGMG